MVRTDNLQHDIVMKRVLFFIIGTVCMVSCIDQEDRGINESSEEIVSLLIGKRPEYHPHKTFDALSGNYDKYLEYFVGTDYEIGVSASKDGGLPGGTAISCISGISQVRQANVTKSTLEALPPIRSFVDGIELSQQSLTQTKASSGVLDCFGKRVKFTIDHSCETKSSDGSVEEVEMYVPEAIEFRFPRAESEDDLNPLCYYKDFVIKWNGDENNENGVLVVVDWTGSMILGNDILDTHVCRVASFPDTGEARLSEEMFEGIPDTAHCDLLILRGNIDNIERGQYTYKMIGKTHHLISFILIREIDNQ